MVDILAEIRITRRTPDTSHPHGIHVPLDMDPLIKCTRDTNDDVNSDT